MVVDIKSYRFKDDVRATLYSTVWFNPRNMWICISLLSLKKQYSHRSAIVAIFPAYRNNFGILAVNLQALRINNIYVYISESQKNNDLSPTPHSHTASISSYRGGFK